RQPGGGLVQRVGIRPAGLLAGLELTPVVQAGYDSRIRKNTHAPQDRPGRAGALTAVRGADPASVPLSPVPAASVLDGLGGLHVLADVGEHVGEPDLVDVEGLAAGDPREGDRGELVAVLL